MVSDWAAAAEICHRRRRRVGRFPCAATAFVLVAEKLNLIKSKQRWRIRIWQKEEEKNRYGSDLMRNYRYCKHKILWYKCLKLKANKSILCWIRISATGTIRLPDETVVRIEAGAPVHLLISHLFNKLIFLKQLWTIGTVCHYVTSAGYGPNKSRSWWGCCCCCCWFGLALLC
jgi:hypothetical protein